MGDAERSDVAGERREHLRSCARAWLDLARISNAPTVVSNAAAGVILASLIRDGIIGRVALAATALACVLIYSGGMALNDVVDAGVDRIERPGRPIPSGRVSRTAAAWAAAALLLAGLAVFALISTRTLPWAVTLVLSVIAYNLLHARTAASVVLLGACRGLVYMAASSAVPGIGPNEYSVTLAAMCIGAYTASFSLLARREIGPREGRLRFLPWLFVFMGPGAMFVGQWLTGALLTVWMLRAAVLWNGPPPCRIRAVMAWIAGLCLIDAVIVVAVAGWAWGLIPYACFVLTLLLHRRILGS